MPNAISDATIQTFQRLLDYHIEHGTRPNKSSRKTYRPWTNATIAHTLGVKSSTVRGWRKGSTYPAPENLNGILHMFFGEGFDTIDDALRLIASYNVFSSFYFVPNSDQPLLETTDADELATQQIPAAYRFGISNGQIDALPDPPETIDEAAAQDIYTELQEKLKRAITSLRTSNSDRSAIVAVERLELALGTHFLDVRPGVLLSRMRSVEAIRTAFNSPEGQLTLFPGSIAMIEDLCMTGQDLLATYPTVRKIEREHLALGLEKNPSIITSLASEAKRFGQKASESEIVTPRAVTALQETEIDIEHATTTEQTADLIADRLLVIRNFSGELLRSLMLAANTAGKTAWNTFGDDLTQGSKNAARILPTLAVLALLGTITGPLTAIAGLLHGGTFKSLLSALERANSKNSSN